jgi:hypothetical protein
VNATSDAGSSPPDATAANSPEEIRAGLPNGESNVAEQYSALHQMQTSHEESLKQLREEIQQQRRAASDMKAALEARIQQLLGASPGAIQASELVQRIQQVEGRLSQGVGHSGGGEARLDAVLLRLSELERKMGEGTPDPLLNEIVHRLAALESNPNRNGSDHRVDEIISRVGELGRKVEQAGPATDPRTDDLVLRIASIESATRRAVQEEQFESLDERLASIEGQTHELSSQSEVEQLRDRLARLESDAIRGDDSRFGQIGARLDEVEARAAEPPVDPRLDEVRARLSSLEEMTAAPAVDERVAEVLDRLGAVEDKVAEPASDPRVTELADRMITLETRLVEASSDPRLLESIERLAALEQQWDSGEREQRQRLAELESRLDSVSDSAWLEEIRSRLADLEKGAEAVDPRVSEVLERLATIEQKGDEPVSDPRVGELASRVLNLESRPSEADPRIEALLARITSLEQTGTASAETAAELQALKQRLAEVEAASGNGQDPRVGELAARLAALEDRGVEPADGASSETVRELVARLQSLEERLGDSSQGDDRVADLAARLSAVENQPSQAAPDPRLDEALARLASLETQPGGGPQTAELAARLGALEKSGVAGADSLVEALQERLEALEQRGGSAAPDKRVTEIIARLDGLEKAHKSGAAAAGLDTLAERVRALEAGSGSPESLTNFQAEFRARYEDLQHRLHQMEAPGPSGEDVKSLIHKESERWTQWARNTLGEIGELRQKVEKLSQGGHSVSASNGAGVSAGGNESLSDAMKTLGDTISESLGKSVTHDVKALRSQMYFVFFTIGMLYALGAFFTYIAMSQGG